ncbi:Increased rDNA silencing protein [Orbilia brochopaga]|uniref:Increased rDNA silencing protein n=1 Tax=Orbilia brochopaga TaxID=3140254 RepID=A0AAV9VET9_9PEZI
MTSTPHAASAGAPKPVTPQTKRSAASSTASTDKPDAALRAATLSFSPPFSRQGSDERSVSPSKTNGTALIAARAIGTGGSGSPRPTRLNSPDRGGSAHLSRNSSYDVLVPSLANAGSLKAARLSVSRTSSTSSESRVKTQGELGVVRAERTAIESEDANTGAQVKGPPTPAKKDQKRVPPIASPPSLLAAGLAVSRLTASGTMASMVQPERDQEPDILPPAGSVNEARKRLLQQAGGSDNGSEVPSRGRLSVDSPARSKHTGTFLDSPPTSTANISPLSAAKLAVQHSGRSAGASSAPPISPKPNLKPRQPSPIKREIKRDDDVASPAPAVIPPPKPAALKKPVIKDVANTTTKPSAPTPAPAAVVKPAAPGPKPAVLKVAPQITGTPPPQPIKPLPRRTKPPSRTPRSPVKETSAPLPSILDGSPESKPVVEKSVPPLPPKPDETATKIAPPLPLPRGSKAAEAPKAETPKPVPPKPAESPKPIELPKPIEPPKPVEPPKPAGPVRRDPRLLGFTSAVKLPPPVVSQPAIEPVKQEAFLKRADSAKLPPLPPKPVEPASSVAASITRPKPEATKSDPPPITALNHGPLKPKTYVDSIVSRKPPSFYTHNNGVSSSSTLVALLPPPPPAAPNRRATSPVKPIRALRPNHTGPESSRTPPKPTTTWRDDLPYNFGPSEEYLRPSHTGDSLHHARLASSLASSRAGSPVKSNPLPLPPRPSGGMRTTMRSPEKSQDRDTSPQKKSHLLGKKHPNKHNEGSRKRWREFVTEKERKRYEGLWAANRGLYLTEKMFEGRPDAAGRKLHQEAVCALVVKDLWSRSRLPLDILEQIWELVDRGPRPKWWLTRDEFIMGLWLIDQSLKGRKLPGKVQDGTWESVRRMGIVLKDYDELGLRDKNKKKR